MYVSKRVVALALVLWVLNCGVLGGIVAVAVQGESGSVVQTDPILHWNCYLYKEVGLAGCRASWGPTYYRYRP